MSRGLEANRQILFPVSHVTVLCSSFEFSITYGPIKRHRTLHRSDSLFNIVMCQKALTKRGCFVWVEIILSVMVTMLRSVHLMFDMRESVFLLLFFLLSLFVCPKSNQKGQTKANAPQLLSKPTHRRSVFLLR